MGRKRAKKCADIIDGDDDRISELPDDILVHIISYLSLKEAVGTSVLSSRWPNLWKHSPCLNFDAHISLGRIVRQIDLCSVKRHKYVKWVNSVIRSHKATILKEFRVCFNLSISARKEVTRWLKFAFVRHVQRLELDFSAESMFFVRRYTYCSFPKEFLTQNSPGIDFKSLRVLSLKCVDVTDEDVKLFLHSFPLLEKLVVDNTHKLLNLEVCGPALALKHLELIRCRKLKSVKVSAPDLNSLILQKVEMLFLENVPKLVEVSVDCRNCGENILPAISHCIFQLEILTLNLTANPEEIVPSTFPELPKLNKLVVKIDGQNTKTSLMGLTTFVRLCPYLQEYVIKLGWGSTWPPVDRDVNKSRKFPHQHLKVFKFCGFDGRASEIQLLSYIVKNSAVLQKVIIDPRYPSSCYTTPKNPDEIKDKQAVKDSLKQGIEAELPQHIELVIL